MKNTKLFQNHLIAHMFKIYRFFSYLFYLARLELLYTDFQLVLPLFYIIACNILYILSCFLQFCRLEVIITDWYAPLCRSAVTYTSPPRWPCSWTQDRSVTILHITILYCLSLTNNSPHALCSRSQPPLQTSPGGICGESGYHGNNVLSGPLKGLSSGDFTGSKGTLLTFHVNHLEMLL